jgi:hypothetical protein
MATAETVISEKRIKALLMPDLIGTTMSRISVIFMVPEADWITSNQ